MAALVAIGLLLLLAGCLVPRDPAKCNFIGALIGAGAALIGGSKNRKAQKEANAANRPEQQVAEWEAAGINPLFGISSGGYIPHQAASIGDSFATAGGILGRSLDMQHEQKLRETQLELENEALAKQIDKLENPSEPGYMQRYGGILPLPSNGVNRGQAGDIDSLYHSSGSAGPSPFPSHADDLGLPKRDQYNLYVDVYDPMTDRWVTIPNPDLMDAGPLETAYAMSQIGGADLLQNSLELGGIGAATAKGPTRPKRRPEPGELPSIGDSFEKAMIPEWGTPEFTEHMRQLYQ